MNIKIYDLFGINIKSQNFNNSYIILDITSPEDIDIILTPISQHNGIFIYRYQCSEEFKQYCNNEGININDYIKLGDYIIYDINDIKIILAHKKSVFITDRYTLLDTIGQLYIWEPHSINNKYTNFGVICLSQTNEIPSDPIGLLPIEHVKIFESTYGDIFQNDYCVLGNKLNGKRKLISLNIINQKDKKIEDTIDDNIDDDIKNYKTQEDETNIWKSYKNDTIMLNISHTPWYIDKKSQLISPKFIKNKNFFRKQKEKPKHKANMSDDDEKNKNSVDKSTYIIIILFVLIILLFLYNKYQKKSNI